MRAIHQVVAGAAPHDAITNHALASQQVLRDMGAASEIFCDAQHLAPALHGAIRAHDEWRMVASPGDAAILHYSIDSPAFDHVLDAGAWGAIQYHNITPAELLWPFNPALALQCRNGRRCLADLVGRIHASSADSSFNALELNDLGFPSTTVIGILRAPRPPVAPLPRLPQQRPQLLFVGRGIPNKCQHSCILAISALRQAEHDVALRLVGSWGGSKSYEIFCRSLIHDLQVGDLITITGPVDDDQLAREYAAADAFLCLSQHEGYCVPIIEALEADLPIVALARGAVPETVGGAGLLINDSAPSIVAEAVLAVLSGEVRVDDAARATQLAHHGPVATAERLRQFAGSFAE